MTDEDLIESNKEVYANPQFPNIRYEIFDVSGVTQFEVSSKAVSQVGAMDQEASRRNPNVRVAIITSEPFAIGLSRLYSRSHKAMGGTWRTEMFDTEEAARNWACTPE
jgi:hypothetical protein